MVLLAAPDASLGSLPRGGSQAGRVVLTADGDVLEGVGNAYVIDTASLKINRIVRSSLAAEVAVANVAMERSEFLRTSPPGHSRSRSGGCAPAVGPFIWHWTLARISMPCAATPDDREARGD